MSFKWGTHRAVAGACAFALSLAASANPENGQIVGGSGSISQAGALTQINQASAALAINWDSFDVGAAEVVQFIQPDVSSVALNRITGGGASEIFGSIDANGSVFLVNTAGVVFAPGSQINVGNLVVSGLDMTVEDFMAGNYALAANGLPGAVINHGTIAAASGGSVVLVGGQVVNTGLIRANYGRVTLAGAEAGYLDFDGDGLLRFEVTGELKQKLDGADAAVTNSGVIEAQGGEVIMQASAARGIFDTLVNNEGIIEAGAISIEGGVIRLVADGGDVVNTGAIVASSQQAAGGRVTLEAVDGDVINEGEIEATSVAASGGFIELVSNADTIIDGGMVDAGSIDAVGGTIHALGNRVIVQGPSRLGSAGGAGGGVILIGGSYQGSNPLVRNASQTFVGADVEIDAGAVNSGDGGTVIVWSDDYTWFFGTVSARGPPSGHGGFVEVSSHGTLAFSGLVDTRAGTNGTLLLDPTNIRICTACTTTVNNSAGTFSDANSDGDGGDSRLLVTDLTGQLNATNVIVTTASGFSDAGNITVETAISWSSNNSLTLTANNNITTNAGASITTTGTGNLTLSGGTATGVITINAVISLNGGDFSATASQITTTGTATIAVGAGDITLTAEEIDLGLDVSGAGTLILQPFNPATSIGIAGGAGTLDLSMADLGHVLNGFSSILIGRSDGSGGITVSAVTFTDPVTLRSPSGGTIAVNGTLAGTGNASITLDGSGATTILNAGITTDGTDITISDNVELADGATVTLSTGATTSGNISITGTTNGNAGAGAESLTVVSGSGTITFTGAVGGGTPLALTLQSDNAGNIGTVTFTAAANATSLTTFAHGYAVVLNGGGTFTALVDFLNTGAVTLGNDTGDTFAFNGGLDTSNGPSITNLAGSISTSNDAITLGPATLTQDTTLNAGTAALTLDSVMGSAFGLTLIGDEIDLLGGDDSVTGSGAISLAPATAAESIGVGDAAAGTLNLSDADLDAIDEGHTSITIGSAAGSHDITIDTAFSFSDPVSFLAQAAGGSITLAGNLGGTDNASITFNSADGTTLGANITTADDDITINDDVVIAEAGVVVLDTGTGGGGNISIAGSVDGTAGNADESLQLISGSGTIGITGAVGGTDPIDLVLQSDDSGNAGAVTFNAAVGALSLTTFAHGYSVALLAGGTITDPVSFLNTAGVTLGDDVGDLTTFDGGVTSTASTTTIAGAVATSDDSLTLGAVVLATDVTLTSGAGAIITGSVTDGASAFDLTLQDNTGASTGGVTLGGSVTIDDLVTFGQAYAVSLHGAANTFDSQVTFLNTGTTTLGNEATDSSTFDAGVTATAGAVSLAGTVATTNDSVDLGAVTLTADSTLRSGSATITVASVTGAFDLTLQDNTAGSTGGVTFTGNVTIDDLVTFGQAYAVSLHGAANTFTSQVTFLNTGTTTLGNEATDSSTFDGGLTANAGAVNVAGSVLTSDDAITLGAFTLTTAVTLDTNATTTAGDLSIGAVTGGGFDLTLETGGVAGADLTGTSVTNAATLTLQDVGGTASFSGSVSVTALTVAGSVAGVSLTGGATVTNAVTFANTGTLTLGDNSGDAFTFTGGVTATAPSSISLGGGFSTTNAGIAFGDADTASALNSDSTFTAGTATVAFDDLNTSASSLTITADGIDFGGGSNSVTGGGAVVLQGGSATTTVGVGGGGGTLQIDTTDLDALADGHSAITIGRSDGTGLVTVGTYAFKDPVTIRAGAPTGDITVSGALSSTDANITLNAGRDFLLSGSVAAGAPGTGNSRTGGSVTITAGGAVTLNGAVSTAAINLNDITNTNHALTGSISVTAGGAISGNASGTLTTGAATTDGTGAAGGETATSGSITVTATGALQLLATDALRTGNATTASNGNDNTTAGSITVSAAAVSSNGTAQLDVSFGTASGGTANTSGTLTATTTGGGGNAGGILITSGEALRVGVLTTAGGSSQNITITGVGITLTDVVHTVTNDVISLDATTGTLSIANGTNDLNVGTGNLSLRGDEINLSGGAGSVIGTGTVTLSAGQVGTAVEVAGAGGTGSLDLTATDIAALANGFSGITIGRMDSTAALTIIGAITFNDNVTLIGGSITSSATLTGSAGVAVTLRSVNGSIIDGDDADTANVTAGTITLIAANGGGIGAIGQSGDRFDVTGVTVLTLEAEGSIRVRGDNATNLTDLIITVDPSQQADSTYQIDNFDGMTFGSTGLVDSGADLFIEGIRVNDNENVAMNITITAVTGDIYLSDSEGDNSSPANLPAIDFSPEGGDITIIATAGDILDQFENDADTTGATFANLIVKTDAADVVTLTASGTVGTGVAASDTDGSGAGSGGDIDIRGTGAFNCSGTTTNCTSNIVGDTYDESIDPAGDVDSFDRVVGAFTINFEPCFTGDVCLLIAENGGDNDPNIVDGSAFTLSITLTSGNLWIYDHATTVDYVDGGAIMGPGGIFDLGTGTITLTAQTGGVFEIANGTATEITAGGTVTINAAIGIGTMEIIAATPTLGLSPLDISGTTLAAHVTMAGNLLINEASALTLTDVDTANGFITITAGGLLTASDVVSTTDADANDITLTGDGVALGTVNAGTTAGDVVVDGGSGAISSATSGVTGQTITLTAGTSIGSGTPITVSTTNLTLTAGTTFAVTTASDLADLTISADTDLNGSTLTAGGLTFSIASTGTDITLTNVTDGALNFTFNALSGNLIVNAIGVGAGALTLTADTLAGQQILDDEGALGSTTRIAGGLLTLTARSGIGTGATDVDTDADSLVISVTDAGVVNIDEADAVTLTSVTTADGAITVLAGGALTVTSVVSTTDADANDISLTGVGITLGTVNAGSVDGDVTLEATTGGIADVNGAGTLNVTGDDVSASGDMAIELDTSADTLTTDTSGGGGANQTLREADGLSDVSLNAGAGTITLTAGGVVGQPAGSIVASGLELLGAAASYALDSATNNVATLAANTGALTYVDAGDLAVGTVNTVGVMSTGAVSLTAGGVNGVLTLTNDITATADQPVTLTADNMTLTAAVGAGAGTVTLQPFTGGTLIDLGDVDASGTLGLTDLELDQITANALIIGSPTAGNLSVTAAIDLTTAPIIPTLTLLSGGNVMDGGGSLAVTNLVITADGIGASGAGNQLEVSVDSLTTDTATAGGSQFLSEANGLTDLNLDAGAGNVELTLTLGGIADTAADAEDIVATSASVTLLGAGDVGATGAAGNIETSVDSLTVSTAAGGGSQFLTEASGLTDLNLDAGAGNVDLTLTLGGIVDTDGATTDVTATNATITLLGAGDVAASANPLETTVDSLTVSTAAGGGSQYLVEANGLTDLALNAGTGDVELALTLGGIADTAGDGDDITAANATVTLSDVTAQTVGATGAAGNIETSVDSLTVSTAAGGGSQFLTEASGLTDLDLDAGAGNVELTLTLGGIADTAADAEDIVATNASVTLLGAGDVGATGAAGNIETSVDSLTTDTATAGGNQFLTEASGLTDLNLDAGAGNVELTLTLGGIVDTAVDSEDITAGNATVILSEVAVLDVGASGNPIETSVGGLTVDTSAGNGSQYLVETNGLTDLNLDAGTGGVELTLTLGGIADTAVDAEDITALNATVTLSDVTAQDVGTSANPLETSVDTLTVATSAGNGDQFLTETSGLTDLSLNAGTGAASLTLTAGSLVDTDGVTTDVTAADITLRALAGSLGASGNPVEVAGLTRLTVHANNSIFVAGVSSPILTDLTITLNTNSGGTDTYSFAGFGSSLTLGLFDNVVDGISLGIATSPGGTTNSTTTLNLSITNLSGNIYLQDNGCCAAIDLGTAGGDITVTATTGNIVDFAQSIDGIEDSPATQFNLRTLSAYTITLNAPLGSVGAAGEDADIDISGTGNVTTNAPAAFVSSDVAYQTLSFTVDPDGTDVNINFLGTTTVIINESCTMTQDACVAIVDNSGFDLDFTLIATNSDIYLADNAIRNIDDNEIAVDPDMDAGSVTLVAQAGGIFRTNSASTVANITTRGAISLTGATGVTQTGSIGTATAPIVVASSTGTSLLSLGRTADGLINVYTGGALQLNGFTSMAGGSTTVGAAGDLLVNTNISQTGVLVLAADVTAGGLGQDGVGTLTIGAGRTVTSSSATADALTLRGVDLVVGAGADISASGVGGGIRLFTSNGFELIEIGHTCNFGEYCVSDAEFATLTDYDVLTVGESGVQEFVALVTVAPAVGPADIIVNANFDIYLDDGGVSAAIDGDGDITLNAGNSIRTVDLVPVTFRNTNNVADLAAAGTITLNAGAFVGVSTGRIEFAPGQANVVITSAPSGAFLAGLGDLGLVSVATGGGQLDVSLASGFTLAVASTISTGAAAITLTADEIDFNGGPGTVASTGTLVLRPVGTGVAIDIGSTSDVASSLSITDDDIAALVDGFFGIEIGRTDGTHTITVYDATFTDGLVLRAPLGTGGIVDDTDDALTDLVAPVLDFSVGTGGVGLGAGGSLDVDLGLLTGSSGGDVAINEANSVNIALISAAGQTVTLSAGAAITDANGNGTNNIVANLLDVTADTGINLDTNVAFLTAANGTSGDIAIREANGLALNTVSAPGQTVTLNGGTGAIADNNAGAVNVTANLLDVTAAAGIDLDTDVVALTASNTSSGGIDISDADDLGLNAVSAATQAVTLASAAGAITDNNGAATNVTGSSVVFSAATGIGSGDPIEIAVSNVAASNTTSGNIELVQPAGNLTAGVSGAGVSNAGGDIVLTVVTNTLEIAEDISSVGNRTTITVGDQITAFGGGVVTADELVLSAVNGISSGCNSCLNLVVGSLQATNSGIAFSSGIELNNTGDIVLADITGLGYAISNPNGGFDFENTGSITIDAEINTGRKFDLTAFGALADITVNADITSGSTAPASFTNVLNAANDVIQTAGTTITSGDVQLFITAGNEASLAAVIANGTVTLVAGSITDNNVGATNVTANLLEATASTGIDLDTAIGFLTAGNSTSGGVNIADTDGFAVNTVGAAGQTVTLNGGTGAITDNNLGAVNVTADLLDVTAATGIDLDTDIVELTASNPTSGGINIADTNALAVNTVSAPTQTVTLNGGLGAITDNNLGATNVTASLLDATGAGVDLDTAIAFLSVGSTGAVNVSDTDGFLVNAIGAAGQTVTLNGGTGAVGDNNAGLTNVAADALDVTAATGIDLDTAIATLTASNTGSNGINITEANGLSVVTVSAPGQTVTLNGGTGGIADGNGLGVNVTADTLSVNSGLGIDLDTDVNSLNGSTGAAGSVSFDELDGVTVTSFTTANGGFTLTSSGNTTLTSVVSSTSNDANDITVTAATGDLSIGTVNAGTTGADVTLEATTGSILNSTSAVTGDVVTLTAQSGVGASGARITTTAATVNATTTAAGAIWLNETNGASFSVTAADGLIDIVTGGNSTLVSIISSTDADANDITILATAGNILVDLVDTDGADDGADGDVTITAMAGSINDAAPNPNFNLDVRGDVLTLDGATGMGNIDALELDGNTLNIDGGTGGIGINDLNGGDVTLALASAGNISYGTDGNIFVDSVVSTGGTVTLISFGGAINDHDDDLLTDISGTTVTLQAFLEVGGNVAAGSGTDAFEALEIVSTTLNVTAGVDASDLSEFAGTAGIVVSDSGGTTLGSLSTVNGDITVMSDGTVAVGAVFAGTTTLSNVVLDAVSFSDAGAGDITADLLTVDAAGPIVLSTDVNTLDAATTAAGAITITEANDIALASVVAFDGAVGVTAGGSIDVDAVSAAGQTVTLDAGGAITDANAGAVNVTSSLLMAMAGTGIALDTDVAFLTASNTTSGDIGIADVDGFAANTISAIGQNVTLDGGTGAIGDNNGGAVNVTADLLDVTAVGVDLDTAIDVLIASSTGAVDISDADDLALETVDAAGQSVTLAAVAGAILDNNGDGVTNVTADSLVVSATSGIEVDTAIATLTASNATAGDVDVADTDGFAIVTVSAPGQTVTLDGGTGAIDDDVTDAVTDITAMTISLTAASGIGATADLETSAEAVTALSTAGDIDLNNSLAADPINGVAVDLETTSGNISFDQTGGESVLVNNAVTNTAGDISITATDPDDGIAAIFMDAAGSASVTTVNTGFILVRDITAANTVTLTSADAIDEDYQLPTAGTSVDPDVDITAASIVMSAVTGIGAVEALEISASTISADTTDGNVFVSSVATGPVTVTSLSTGTGTILFGQTGGQTLTINSAITDGFIGIGNDGADLEAVLVFSNNADLFLQTTTSGDIDVGQVGALAISLDSAGAITDTNGAATNVGGALLDATAATGIDLDASIFVLSASNTTSGGVNISDNNGFLVDTVTASGQTVTLNGGAGSIGDNNGAGLTNVTANLLDVTAATGIALETDIVELTASNTTSGGITIVDANGFAANAITAAGQAVTLDGGVGAITDNNGAATNVTADVLVVGAETGIDLDTAIAELTASNDLSGDVDIADVDGFVVNTVSAASQTVTLDGGSGAIGDNNAGAVNVTASLLDATATTGISLDTDITSLTASNATSGGIDVADTSGIAVNDVTAAGQTVTLNAGTGALTDNNGAGVTNVTAGALDATATSGINLDTAIGVLIASNSSSGGISIAEVDGFAADAITAAGQLVTLDGGTGAITDNNGATTNVTGGLLTVTASTGIDLDTAIAFLTATNTTSGGINVSDTDGFGVNTVTAGGQTVTLNGGTGALSDANGPATNVTAGLLDATATTGINLDTAIDFLTATNATVGGITIGDTDGFAVNAVTAAGQLVTLDAGTGALADGNGAATNVTALGLVASAATGIDLDTAVDVVNAGNTTSGGIDISDTDGFGLGVASAPLQAVALNGGTGAITDDNGAGTNVTADTLSITASTGIDVDTAINFLTASNTTSGGINIEDTNGFALNTVTAAGQTVTLDGGTGAITDNNAAATNVSANLFVGIATTGIDLDTAISQLTALNTTSGDIDIADTDGFVVNAIGAPGQTVTLNGGTGGIGDNNGTATNVTAGTLDATATTGISLDTSIAFLTASNTGVGGIDITDTDSVAVNTVTAAGQLVVLNAGTGALTDNNGAAVNVTADQFTATAPTGINLDIDANTLTFTSGGAVNLSEVDDIVLAGASTADSLLLTAGATISDGTDGDLNVTGNAAFDGTAITLGNDAGNNTNFGTLTFTSPGAVSIAEDSATQFAGSSAADSLALTSTGAITQTAGSSVSVITLTTLTTPTAGSNVILDQGNDFGTVSLVGANSVTINDTDGDASAVNDGLVLGATNVNSLTATTVGALSDNGTVGVAVAAVFSGSSITLGSAGETTSFGRLTFTSPGAVSIETDTGITLVGASQAGSLSLSANGAIGEFDGTTTLGVTGLTTLTATNNNVALDNGHVLGTVSVTDAVNVVLVTSASDPDGIVLGDITTVSGGDLSVTTAAGNIDGSGGALQISGDSTFTVNNAVITVDNAGNDFTNTVSFFGATDVSVLDTTALDLAGADLTGNLTVVAAGITATDAVVVGGLASFDAGAGNDLELLDGGNDFETLEVVSAANVSVFDLDDITLGDITASGALMLDADSVASTGDVMVAGTTTINSSVGDVLLGGANDFVGAVDIASAGDIGINDVNDLSLNLLSGNAIVITAGGGVLDAAADLGTPLARGEDDILAGGALSITASSIGSSTDALEISAPNDGVATLDAGGIVVDFSNDVHFAGGLSIANASTAEITAQTITVDGDFGESITDLHLIARDVIIGGDGTITALRLQLDALNLVSNDDGDNVIGSIAAPVFLNLANGSDYVVPEPTLYPGNNNELNGFGFISASNFTGTDFNDIFNDSNNRVFLIANFTDLIASVQGSFITAQIFTIDSSQFRADLNIFGVDGAGILLPLDQCEDEESADCAKQ